MDKYNYRKRAFMRYAPICAHCGFGIPAVLEVAHVDRNRRNNDVANLVILCPNCHKMFDLDMISGQTITEMRDRSKNADWAKRMKNAGKKALLTRKKRQAALRRKRRLAARKAAETRMGNIRSPKE